jgi:hypothetical protein
MLEADMSAPNGSTESEHAKRTRAEKRDARLRWLEVCFAGAVALFALVQAGVSYRQWDVMSSGLTLTRESNETARQVAEAAHDQVVIAQNVYGAHLHAQLPGPIGKGQVLVPLKNYGQMPALKTIATVAVFRPAGGPVTYGLQPAIYNLREIEVAPGEIQNLSVSIDDPKHLEPSGIEGFKRSPPDLLVRIRYDNGLGVPIEKFFCFFYVPASETWSLCDDARSKLRRAFLPPD